MEQKSTDTDYLILSVFSFDTTSPAGRMVLTVFAGLAEFERELIKERTGTCRIAAMKRGVRFGRPSSLNAEQAKLAKRLLEEGKSPRPSASIKPPSIGQSHISMKKNA